jgi:hypothetical protein
MLAAQRGYRCQFLAAPVQPETGQVVPGEQRAEVVADESAGRGAAAQAAAGVSDPVSAGAPELITCYENDTPAARALLDVAVDARRLGMGVLLPAAFLEAAAPDYIVGAD